MNPEKLMVGKNCQIQQLIQNNTFIMKFLYILLIYFSPYILIASQSMVSLLEESFYNETEGYVSKENICRKQAYWEDSLVYMPPKRVKLLLY